MGLRLRAAFRLNGIADIIVSKISVKDSSTSTKISERKEVDVRQNIETASRIIISALENAPSRAVADDDDDEPTKMMELLDAHYASNIILSRIFVRIQMYDKRYNDRNMSKYIDKTSALFSQQEFIGKQLQSPNHKKLQYYLLL